MILVDISVWADHLRAGDQRLVALLGAGEVLGHPCVLGEIALGHLPCRELKLRTLGRFLPAATTSHQEMPKLIDRAPLYGQGIGYVDAHLLAAVRLTPNAKFWSRDARFQRVAAGLGLAAMPQH